MDYFPPIVDELTSDRSAPAHDKPFSGRPRAAMSRQISPSACGETNASSAISRNARKVGTIIYLSQHLAGA